MGKEQNKFFIKTHKIWPVLAVFTTGLLLSLYLFYLSNNYEKERVKEHFITNSDNYVLAIEREFEENTEVLFSFKAFFDSSQYVDREEFGSFSEHYLEHHKTIQALEWIPRILYKDKEKYEQSARNDGLQDFFISERSITKTIVPVRARAEYYPVYFVEPLEGNKAAVGFDLASNERRREALNAARDSGDMVATSRITLVQEKESQAGILVFGPIYKKATAHPTVEERRKYINGFTLGVYRIGDIIADATSQLHEGIELYIWDITDKSNVEVLYSTTIQYKTLEQLEHGASLYTKKFINIAGRKWLVFTTPGFGFYNMGWHLAPFIIFCIGLISTILASFYLFRILRSKNKIEDEVKKQTKALRASEEKNRAIVESTINGVITIDEMGIIQTFNPASEGLFGYSAEEIIGQNIKVLMPDSYAREHDGYLKNYREGGDRKVIASLREIRGKRKNGKSFPAELTVGEAILESGQKIFTGMLRDISKEKKVQEELREYRENLEILVYEQTQELQDAIGVAEAAKDKAEQANTMKSEFLANMSHELRTPLNSLLILADMLRNNSKNNLTEEQIEDASTIYKSGKELLELINDILDLAKIESGKMIFHSQDIDLKTMVLNCKNSLIPIAQNKGLTLNAVIEVDAPKIIHSEQTRIEHVLRNLLSNAIKFTHEGSVVLRAYKPTKEEMDGYGCKLEPENIAAISVTDTGIGIAQDKFDLIFESFQQADGSTSRHYGGTGLGLSITQKFIKGLGGEIYLESKEDRGSVFTVYLPIDMPENIYNQNTDGGAGNAIILPAKTSGNIKQNNQAAQIEPATNIDELQGVTVLLVDDDQRNIYALSRQMKEAGINVITAENGQISLEVLAENSGIDIVLMDIMMPIMDGYKAIECIRNKPEYDAIPVIALTAKAMGDDKEKCLEIGANDYLLKPVDTEQFFAMIHRLCDLEENYEEGRKYV